MKNVIIGTAGHVDHGKTQLIKALTGIDTDRLQEEKKRGITIELGFAHIDFENGIRAGIIDVPGHEKFIKNMLAGAGGIDIAMLVVAANEGFMPQTAEHLEIMSLLGIQTGLIVITKIDLVEQEWLEIVREDIAEHVRGTFLEGAAVIQVSAFTGAGLKELKTHLQSLVEACCTNRSDIALRLPIDRSFSIEGFGTVVTGTLIEGRINRGDEVMLYPSGQKVRVRNLHVHGSEVTAAFAGQRVAVNLAGLRKNDVQRGDVLAKPDSMHTSQLLDVRLCILPGASRVVKSGTRLHLYHGARTILCKVMLLDKDALLPGERGFARLKLEETLAARMGDRFVVRFYSPLETIGGGVILNENPRKHQRKSAGLLASLAVRENGSPGDKLLQVIADDELDFKSKAFLSGILSMTENELDKELSGMEKEGKIIQILPGRFVSRVTLDKYSQKLLKLLDSYHRSNPLQTGQRRDEIRQKLFGESDILLADSILEYFQKEGLVRIQGQRIALSGFDIRYSPTHRQLRELLQKAFMDAGYEALSFDEVYQKFPNNREECRQVLDALIADEVLVMISQQFMLHRFHLERALAVAKEYFQKEEYLTLAGFRDLLNVSRKYALLILEYWDRIKITRKVGDNRILVVRS